MIHSDYKIISSDINFTPTMEDFDSTPTMSFCTMEFCREHGGPYVNRIMDELDKLNEFDFGRKAKITILNQHLCKGSLSIHERWHTDWHAHSDNTFNMNKERVCIFWFGSSVAPTHFYVGPLPEAAYFNTQNLKPHEYMNFRDQLVERALQKYDEAEIHVSTPNTIYEMRYYTMHTPTPAFHDGKRILVKIEESDRPPLNRIIRTTTVHVPVGDKDYTGPVDEYL